MKPKNEIKKIIEEIITLGAVLPGSVSKIYNVCGKKNCKCKDPVSPKKHGPYNLLSFTIGRKSSTKFIKDEDLKNVKSMQKNYQRLKAICQELPLAYLELVKQEDSTSAKGFAEEVRNEFLTDGFISEKRLMHANKGLEKKVNSWRTKATERTHEINILKSQKRQFEKSRDEWKKRALNSSRAREGIKKKKKNISRM